MADANRAAQCDTGKAESRKERERSRNQILNVPSRSSRLDLEVAELLSLARKRRAVLHGYRGLGVQKKVGPQVPRLECDLGAWREGGREGKGGHVWYWCRGALVERQAVYSASRAGACGGPHEPVAHERAALQQAADAWQNRAGVLSQ